MAVPRAGSQMKYFHDEFYAEFGHIFHQPRFSYGTPESRIDRITKAFDETTLRDLVREFCNRRGYSPFHIKELIAWIVNNDIVVRPPSVTLNLLNQKMRYPYMFEKETVSENQDRDKAEPSRLQPWGDYDTSPPPGSGLKDMNSEGPGPCGASQEEPPLMAGGTGGPQRETKKGDDQVCEFALNKDFISFGTPDVGSSPATKVQATSSKVQAKGKQAVVKVQDTSSSKRRRGRGRGRKKTKKETRVQQLIAARRAAKNTKQQHPPKVVPPTISPVKSAVNIPKPPRRPGSVFDPPKSLSPTAPGIAGQIIKSESVGTTTPQNLAPSTSTDIVIYQPGAAVSKSQEDMITSNVANKMSRFPEVSPCKIYFAYPVQHETLKHAQKILEYACFHFVKQHASRKTSDRQFSHPESAELNMWVRLIRGLSPKISLAAFDLSVVGKGISFKDRLEELSKAMEELRHSVVHRRHSSAQELQQYLRASYFYAKFLRDLPRAEQLKKLREKLEELTDRVMKDKKARRHQLQGELEKIERERQEVEDKKRNLDDWEELATLGAIRGDQKALGEIKIDFGINLGWLPTAPREIEPKPSAIEVDAMIRGRRLIKYGEENDETVHANTTAARTPTFD
ncbi:hypothetical protein H072_9288 [Dactylellina haptotyla CBS 200.50]|uniref:Uncharacterized protein n=1 Tax=Dactylellina haptotyla (strain CBS 200.50) TaxID=1284197 RepID=S8A7I3_DACHA|nr:hypothetical protein H072_9288 [Dactylellina haptotyla CBS 200.50]